MSFIWQLTLSTVTSGARQTWREDGNKPCHRDNNGKREKQETQAGTMLLGAGVMAPGSSPSTCK